METTLTERTLSYGGDVTPQDAWQAITTDNDAVSIVVRAKPESKFVGVPDLSRAGKQPVLVEWRSSPSMAQHPSFADRARRGVGACFDASGGFEGDLFGGDLDGLRHRGATGGRQAAGPPRRQS
ncbi:MAG: rhodanese-like domain-containing protein [Alphaproteobacteria bacterium]